MFFVASDRERMRLKQVFLRRRKQVGREQIQTEGFCKYTFCALMNVLAQQKQKAEDRK